MGSRVLAGRYELLEKIGEGGMAVVYKARCRLLNRFVAVKILKPEYVKDIKFIENFRRESQAAASLNHPNIVNVYDVGKEGNIHYIVMEFIEGRPLSDIIREQAPLSPARAVSIAKQVAQALAVAHAHHIIHRDVKPHNILITDEGNVKITDFGIAKAVNTSTIMGNTGTVMGSVHYFSPEQARGGYVDEKSDIYSLGIVLYEMLTGEVPFDAENPVSIAVMHMNEEIVPPSEIMPGISRELEDIVLRATDKFQVNRFSSAEEMVDALEDLNYASDLTFFAREVSDEKEGKRRIAKSRNSGRSKVSEKEYDDDYDDYDDYDGYSRRSRRKKQSGKGTKKSKKITALAIVLALVLAVPASYFIYHGISGLLSKEEVSVPDIKGMTYEEAEAKLAKYDLEIEKGETVKASEQYEEGQISSQEPEAGSKVKEGSTIVVDVVEKIKSGKVPNLEGKTFQEAVEALDEAGYKLGRVEKEKSNLPKDTVTKTSPEAGEKLKKGEEVKLWVSRGDDDVVRMPNVVGESLENATSMLEGLGLIKRVTYVTSSDQPENYVIWQQYKPNTELKKGNRVNIRVSKGSENKEGKATVNISFSKATSDVFYMTVSVTDSDGTRTVIANEPRNKADGQETVTVTGKGSGTVKVIFDERVVQEQNVRFN